MSRLITTPLRNLAAVTTAVAEGDLTRRVPVRSHNELGRLGENFNAMADEIESYVGSLRLALQENKELLVDSIRVWAGILRGQARRAGVRSAVRAHAASGGGPVSALRKVGRLLLDLLRELADENAHARHLAHHGESPSPDAWRRFSEERLRAKYGRVKCC